MENLKKKKEQFKQKASEIWKNKKIWKSVAVSHIAGNLLL